MSERIAVRVLCGMLGLVFLLALGAVRSSWTENQAVGIKTEQQAAEGVHKQEAERGLCPEIRQQAPAADRQATEKKGEAGEEASEFGPTIFGYRFKITDGLLVLFTAILAWKTAGLDKATRKLWEAGERQILVANRSADAAVEALSGGRAWLLFGNINAISFSNATFPDGSAGHTGISFGITWKNFGATPAISPEVLIQGRVVDINDKVVSHFYPIESLPEKETFPIPPAGTGASVEYFLTDEQSLSFKLRKIRVIIYSKVVYYDIYKADIVRVSELCLSISFNGTMVDKSTGAETINYQIRPVGSQNSAN